MHKKKVLFMINSMYGGGAEKVLQTIINNIDQEKYEITVYSLHREKIDKKIYKKSFNYKVVFDLYQGKNRIKKIFSNIFLKIKGKVFSHCSSNLFYTLFIHEKFDVEIAFIEGESTKIISGSNNKLSKKIAWVHVDLIENPWSDFIYKNVDDESRHYSKFDKIVCVSNATKKAFIDKYRIDDEKVVVHYNPIDTEDIIKKAGEKNNTSVCEIPQIMAVGRLVNQKGFDRLLKAINRLKEEQEIFKLHIIGEGSQKEELNNYILKNNLQEYVKLHGYIENPYKLMKNGDILICSSRAEGFSLVIAEAIILGLAIVTTNCSGPVELIEDGKYGLLIENSQNGIYEGLKKLLNNKELIKEYKRKSNIRKNIFKIENNIKELEKLIDE